MIKTLNLFSVKIYHLRFSINVIGLRQYVNPKLNCLKMDAILMWADLNIIMSELNALGAWATENLSGIDLKYMSERIENLKSVFTSSL